MIRNPRIRKNRLFYGRIVIGMLLLVSLGACSGVLSEDEDITREAIGIEELKTSATFTSELIIDNNGGTTGAITWSQAKSTYGYCTGTGTENDPYVFENHDFLLSTGGGSCLTIRDSSVYFIVRNCEFKHSGGVTSGENGITLESVQNGQILNNDCSFNLNGIGFPTGSLSRDISISNNILNNNTQAGVYVEDCSDITISGNKANYNGEYGLYLKETENTTISGNDLNQNTISGIYFWTSVKNMIMENSLSQNGLVGIYFEYSSHQNIVTKNSINNNEVCGFYLYSSDSNSISANTINNNQDGIHGDAADNNFIYLNSINNNIEYGIYLTGCVNNLIMANTILGTSNTVFEHDNCKGSNTIKANIYTSSAASGIPGYDLLVLFGGILMAISILLILMKKMDFKIKF